VTLQPRRVILCVAPWVVLVSTLCINLWRLPDSSRHLDEEGWFKVSEKTFELYVDGRFDAPFWSENRISWGYPGPPFSKLLIGAGASVAPHVTIYPPLTPRRQMFAAGRLPSAIMGALGATAFFLIARRILGDATAFGAVGLLVTSPLWLLASRRVMVDVYAVAFSLIATYLFIRGREEVAGRMRPSKLLGYFGAAGLALGAAVGSKYTAVGAAVGLGVLLAVDVVRTWRANDPQRRAVAPWLFASGLLMTLLSFAVLIGSHPYLYTDPLVRLLDIVAGWDELWAGRVKEEWQGAYMPGLGSFSEFGQVLLYPGAVARWLLVPALIAASVGATRAARRRYSAEAWASAIWLLAVPALLTAIFLPSRLFHPPIVWVGMVGALLLLGIRETGVAASPRARAAVLAFAFAWTGWAVVVLRTTYVTWFRFYLPLIPACALIAAFGLRGMIDMQHRAGAAAARRLVLAAWVLGPVVVLSSGLRYERSTMEEANYAWPPVTSIEVLAYLPPLALLASALALGVQRWRSRPARTPGVPVSQS
jgi:4-amino-4-deoxy-L-arabinose transferase-like glycosyltransferase